MSTIYPSTGEEVRSLLVEQEAAIDDYLASLLKDFSEPGEPRPLQPEPVFAEEARHRKSTPISLTIVAKESLVRQDRHSELDTDAFDESETCWSIDRVETAVGPLDLDLPQGMAETSPETDTISCNASALDAVPSQEIEATDPVAASDAQTEIAVAVPEAELAKETRQDEGMKDAAPVQPPSIASDHAEVAAVAEAAGTDNTWRIFSVGAVKVALPVDEIHTVVSPPVTIDSLNGAPAHVAGSILHQGKRRMILSLASWLPGASNNTASQVVLLGAGGLWGVQVGFEQTGVDWDDNQTNWRTESERTGTRPWLLGVNRTSGLIFLGIPALRAALRSPRSGS